jgi:hypothetical protein
VPAPDSDGGEPGDAAPLESTCTTCSICIDDFEEGETLVLLPRCRHSFHRDCLHPWLTERQGCCPLCKTNVLEKDETGTLAAASQDEDGSSSSSSDNSDSTPAHRDEPSTVAATSTTTDDGVLDDSDGSIRAANEERRPNTANGGP